MRTAGLITLFNLLIIFELSSQTAQIIYQQSFDSIPADWITQPTPGTVDQLWQWTSDGTGDPGPHWGKRSPIRSISGPGAFIFNSDLFFDAINPGNHNATAEMPPLDCSGVSAVYLSFSQYYRSLTGVLSVEMSPDGGMSWTAYPVNIPAGHVVESPNGQRVILNLTNALAGSPDARIRFRFDGLQFFWIIDDIMVTDDLPTTDIGILGLAKPLEPCLLTDEEKLQLVLTNNGKDSITQFQFTYSINGSIPLAVPEVFSPALQSGETRVFDPGLVLNLSGNTGYLIQLSVNTVGDSIALNNSTIVDLPPCPLSSDSLGGEYISNQLIVRFKPGTTDAEKDFLRDKYNASPIDHCLCDPGLELWEIDLSGGGITIEGVKDQASSESKIEDTGFEYLIKLDKPKNGESIQLEEPPMLNIGPGVKVAVIDSGDDFDHVDLMNSLWVNDDEAADPIAPDDDLNCFDYDDLGYNFIDEGNLPQDDNGHGSHIAGIIALGLPDCVSAQIMSLKTMNQSGAGLLFHSLCAIYYASDKGAAIINYSAGYVGEESSMFRKAIRYAKSKNVIMVASAGNEGKDNDLFPHYPSQFSIDEGNVIAVGSHGSSPTTRSNFSNFGTVVDVAASGEQVFSTIPGAINHQGYGLKDGTSMAAGKVSRQLVLFLANNSDATYSQSRDFLESLATTPVSGISRGSITELTNCAPVGVRNPVKKEVSLTAFPNPFGGEFRMEFQWPKAEIATVSVFDALGRRMIRQSISPAPGSQILSVDGHDWPAGTYFLFMESAHYQAREVVVKGK